MNRIALPICGLVVLVIGATQGAPPTRADDVFVVAPQERAERAPWVEVSGDGVELHVGRAHGAFALSQVSRGVGGEALGRATASRTRDGAELRRGSVHEWWRARRSDLEHGITLTRRPSGDGPLRLTLALGGGLRAVDGLADAIALRDETGATVARYTHLVVVDADERVLEAHMIADAGAIRIDVDDVDAAYPIVVDPVVAAEEATLDSPGAVAGRQLGWSVAISGDGLRAIVGAPLDDTVVGTDSGSVSIFLRTGTTWSREATILPTSAPARYGYAVAIADDGSRAVVGAPFEGSSGVVHLLVRTGTTWTEETSFGGNISFPSFGTAVAIAGDASSAVVGDSAAHPGASTTGGFRPYTRAGTTWTAGTATFGAASSDAMGVSVALSGNGSYLVVGATGVTTGGMAAGAAYVYLRTGSTYVPQATLTPAAPTSTDSQFGQAVAIATDGSRVVIGYTGDGSFGNLSGSARVFSRAGTIWSAEATLGPSPATSPGAFGNAVALSADGSRALIGYQYDNTRATSAGSGRLFTRTHVAINANLRCNKMHLQCSIHHQKWR